MDLTEKVNVGVVDGKVDDDNPGAAGHPEVLLQLVNNCLHAEFI